MIIDTGADDVKRSLSIARTVIDAGCRWIQLREKSMSDRNRLSVAEALCDRAGVDDLWVFVNDRPDIAILCRATGLHIGQSDLPLAAARRLLAAAGLQDTMIGVSARTPQAALAAQHDGADYVGCGPIFKTTTKPGLPEPIGLSGLEAVADAVRIPVIAIGGITPGYVESVLLAGASGVAVCGWVMQSDDPGSATEQLLGAIQRAKARKR